MVTSSINGSLPFRLLADDICIILFERGIVGIGDKKKERQIQREMELVEQLQSKYEDLEEAIDEAYSLDTVKESTENAIENLEAQNKHYQNMINAENDKKDSDGDRIKEWEAQIKENKMHLKLHG